MNSKRVFILMIGVCVILSIGILGVVFVGDSILKKQADTLTELKLEDRLLDEQQSALTQANKDIAQYEELEQIAKSVVPQDKDQARAVREIIGLAKEAGITIDTISFPTSSLGSKATKTASSSDNAGEVKTTTATPSAITQATPVEGVPGVYSIEMTITPSTERKTTYYQLLDLLEKLETNRRTAQVTSVRVTPISSNASNPYISFTLTINIFVKP